MPIHKDRIKHYAGLLPDNGKYVLYWMQQAQRTRFNHALAFAASRANELRLPLVVGFVLTPSFPEANIRHYRFMLQGLAEVQAELQNMHIPFVLKIGEMVETVLSLAQSAAWTVTDVGYLKIHRQWRKKIEQALRCPYTEIETDVVVPVAAASNKEEYGARTLRPKLMKQADDYLSATDLSDYRGDIFPPPIEPSAPIDAEEHAIRVTNANRGVKRLPQVSFQGGYLAASKHLETFIQKHLSNYPDLSRDPVAKCQSNLSPYLHFGQISPIEIMLSIRASKVSNESKETFIEQLLVRRELAINFVHYNPGYDQYDTAVPGWAKKTLADHANDPRPHIYTYEEFETGHTHDPYWNAAQIEMVKTGKMHNYMRMYWGKKIIEWTKNPQDAFDIMLALNNRYELDGRDPNGFTGVAWCFGRHDRAWKEREIFGKIRFMNAAGLERKFKIAEYVAEHIGSTGKKD